VYTYYIHRNVQLLRLQSATGRPQFFEVILSDSPNPQRAWLPSMGAELQTTGTWLKNASECRISHLQFQNFAGVTPPNSRYGRDDPLLHFHQHGLQPCAGLHPNCYLYPSWGLYILRASSVYETFRRRCS